MNYEIHPAANAFPMMDAERFEELKADIEQNGQLQPITLCDGMVLDGRNRYKACQELGMEVSTKIHGGDPWVLAWSLNGARRDLVGEQRYLIWKHCHEGSEAWKKEQMRLDAEASEAKSKAQMGNKNAKKKNDSCTECSPFVSKPKTSKTREAKATASKTNKGAVARGDQLADERPDLAEAVRNGEMKPAEAHRQMKRDKVAEKVEALPEDKYTVIYADPPWKYNDAQAVKGDYGTGTGAANCHYPSMTMTELKALDVAALAADDCVLFLWATCPLLEDALALAKAWGFKYKAQFVWDKVKHNMGHYNSVRHELLLICTNGSCTPQNVKLFDSVQSIERTKHSEKPETFREIIDTIYPHGNRIELFARKELPDNWKGWGNESA